MLFKRKKKEEKLIELPILIKYIEEARRLNWDDGDIREKFKERGYTKEVIEVIFTMADMKRPFNTIERRNKMAKKEEEYEEDDEDEDFEDDDDDDDDESEDEVEEPKKLKKKKPGRPKLSEQEVVKPVEQKISINDVLQNHEQRIIALESRLYRMLTV